MMDFTDYKTASRYESLVNAGYWAYLFGLARNAEPRPESEPDREAWLHGWDMASKSGNVLLRDDA